MAGSPVKGMKKRITYGVGALSCVGGSIFVVIPASVIAGSSNRNGFIISATVASRSQARISSPSMLSTALVATLSIFSNRSRTGTSLNRWVPALSAARPVGGSVRLKINASLRW